MSGGILTYRTHGHRVVLSQGEGIGFVALPETPDVADPEGGTLHEAGWQAVLVLLGYLRYEPATDADGLGYVVLDSDDGRQLVPLLSTEGVGTGTDESIAALLDELEDMSD